MQVRPCANADEMHAAFAPIWHYFGQNSPTGDVLKYYSQLTDDVVRPAVKNKQVSTTANVVRAAVSDLAPDKATVLVFVNQATTSADRAEPSMTASSVKVTLDRVDGKWLIAAFDPV